MPLIPSNSTNEIYIRNDRICNVCDAEIPMDNLCLACDECDKLYHPRCKGIVGRNLKPLSSLSEWFCDSECKNQYEMDQTTETIVDTSDRETIKMLLMFKETVMRDMEDIKRSQQFLSDLVDELRKENALILRQNEQLKQQVEQTKQESNKYNETARDIEGEINKIKQDKLTNNIVITNMPKGNNCVDDFWNLTTKIDAKIEKSDVVAVELMHSSNNKNKNKRGSSSRTNTVLVRFNNHHAKIELIKKKSRAGSVLHEQFATNKNAQQNVQAIYFRDHLTSYGLDLFAKCKSIQKQAKLKYCWTKDCQIYLRESEKSKVIKITSLADVDSVKKQYTQKK